MSASDFSVIATLFYNWNTELLTKFVIESDWEILYHSNGIVSKLIIPLGGIGLWGVVISFLQNRSLIPAHEFSYELCSEKEGKRK